MLFNSVNGDSCTLSDFPFDDPGWLVTYYFLGNNLQIAYSWTDGSAKYRVSHFGEYLDWQKMSYSQDNLMNKNFAPLPGCDLDDIILENGFYLLKDSEKYENMPLKSVKKGFLQVQYSGNETLQTFYTLTDKRIWKRSFSGILVREPGWVLCSGDLDPNANRIYNTYIIPTQPSIAIDNNGWLQAIDDETTDEDKATDMTGAIMLMLKSTGKCCLGPGTFYVSGNIDLPAGTTLEGSGSNTILRLLPTDESTYIVRILDKNTVRGIRFSGGKTAPSQLFTNETKSSLQNGIVFTGNGNGKEATRSSAVTNIIENCWFENFDGAGLYGYNTGGSLKNTVNMSDCFIDHCRVGINLDYFVEYSKFSDCIITSCYYACINNGGNNVFTGCTFHGVVGWMCDNTDGDKYNNMHGSCIGCTFNHLDNMNHSDLLGRGSAVIILSANHGFVFDGCQFWYGNIIIDDSRAIMFDDCLFGNEDPVITVTGEDYGVFFHDDIFYNMPILQVNSKTKFINCYDSEGTLIRAIVKDE